MKTKFPTGLLKFVPKNHLSQIVGAMVHVRLPKTLARASVSWFAKRYSINMAEAEFPIEHYESIGTLFTRRLKPGIRPIKEGVVHPADSKIIACGPIRQGQLLQAKGKTFSVAEFLASEEEAKRFEGGWFVTYYLCPTDYHRVHSPVTGSVSAIQYVPGNLWPVNGWGLANVDRLFAVNERVIMYVDTAKGRAAVTMVGATNVGRIVLTVDSSVTANSPGERRPFKKAYRPGISVKAGNELGVFQMGSTVIVLFEAGVLSTLPESWVDQAVHFGETLG